MKASNNILQRPQSGQDKVATAKTDKNSEYRVRVAAPAEGEKDEYHVEAAIDEKTPDKLQKPEEKGNKTNI